MKKILVAALLIGCSSSAFAQVTNLNPLSPSLYYEIGGGKSFNRPLSENTEASRYGIGAQLELPLNCGIWDERHLNPDLWGDAIADYAEGQLNQLGQNVVGYLMSAGQGLAVAALQRALPGMYAYSQSLTASVEGRIASASQSCEDVVQDINNGVNPLDPWRAIGTAVSWRSSLRVDGYSPGGNAAVAGLPDTVIAAERAVAQATNQPIPWFGGLRGDADNPITVTEDLIRAGFNIHSGTANNTVTPDAYLDDDGVSAPMNVPSGQLVQGQITQGTIDSRLSELFVDQGAAINWAKTFLGEQEVFTCSVDDDPDGCASRFQPGLGLSSMISEEVVALTSGWETLIGTANRNPSIEEMRGLSSPTVMISPEVYGAILGFEAQDQDLYIGRLINDVALSLTVEKALAVRKMLISGAESPVVKGYVQADTVANDLIDKIKFEIDELMWNMEAQEKLTSNTSAALLEYDAWRRNQGNSFIATGRGLNTVNTLSDRPSLNTEVAQ